MGTLTSSQRDPWECATHAPETCASLPYDLAYFNRYLRPIRSVDPRPAAQSASNSGSDELLYDLESKEPKIKGKWYFEVKVDGAAIQKQAEVTFFIGVSQAEPAQGAANENGQASGTFVMIRRNNRTPDSGTLGFAVDLDNGKLYTSQDGTWDGGAPGSAGGLDLLKGRSYKAFLNSSSSVNDFLKKHALEMNYGGHAFLYHLPDGYKPLEPNQSASN